MGRKIKLLFYFLVVAVHILFILFVFFFLFFVLFFFRFFFSFFGDSNLFFFPSVYNATPLNHHFAQFHCLLLCSQNNGVAIQACSFSFKFWLLKRSHTPGLYKLGQVAKCHQYYYHWVVLIGLSSY